ncbi:MAG: LamG domain-containing protein, partial [Nanoarchaeota archaeon]
WRVQTSGDSSKKSIALLNMPFERNLTYNATDYSTYKKHANTVFQAVWNKRCGRTNTGCYKFDGTNDHINISDSVMPTRNMTISFFLNATDITTKDGLITKWLNETSASWAVEQNGTLRMYVSDGTAAYTANYAETGKVFNANKWYHVAVIYNGSASATNKVLFYVDGKQKIGTVVGTIPSTLQDSTSMLTIGGYSGNLDRFAAAWIDDVKIYNRTLSANEIKLLNLSKDNIMHSDETVKNQNWTACITPNDGVQDGLIVCSNNITIRNSIPTTPIPKKPNNANDTLRNLNVSFNWTRSTDADSDAITYYINLTSRYCANQQFEGIVATNYTSPELSTVDVCSYYNWTVRAYDGKAFSPYSTIFNFSIQPYVNITLLQNTSDFGFLSPGQSNDTTDENPQSFVVESNSNVLVNVTVRGLDDLWDSEALGSNSFRYKTNETAETNSFDFTNSQRTFRAITGSATKAIKELKRIKATNTAEIELEITAPVTESPGMKKSNIILEAAQS